MFDLVSLLSQLSKPPIVLFGGSFDPPHNGHFLIIKHILAYPIAKLLIVPSFLNPFKTSSLFSPQQRQRWLEQIIMQEELQNVEILDFEIEQNRPTPTILTVKHTQGLFPNIPISLIVGEDQLGRLSEWNQFEKLKKEVSFIIFGRSTGSYDVGILEEIQCAFVPFECAISSTDLREKIKKDIDIASFIPFVL
ncbi:nicotinate (nicotinamide) nucleotide adenylyltransferase [Helicobacter monodelphidis]|uniref:nicotinate (nicotinamide) nucleotide adenylyltransferase n=1 Tax=Helicobacter sp. 15-1451 TaxID=2004995 RepID=UPI000DCEA23D|nr:nicotinate (nicotinamide) nucleotide adenylyltransferase [Helicobacter sp. 15-1451]RAX58663.1 nicotinate (nicotinamide) nucleotide adenylyltransferase [Helicobacter sp. 15-1451]